MKSRRVVLPNASININGSRGETDGTFSTCVGLRRQRDQNNETLYLNSVDSREHKNYLYIFAVNAAQKVEKLKAVHDGGPAYRVTAKFGPVKSVSSQVIVINEGRTIDLSGGYFADSFEPLGTHIYKVSLN